MGKVAGISRLTALEVYRARSDLNDGGGLLLRRSRGGATSHWIFRYTSPSGKRREASFGPVDQSSQRAAAESVVAARQQAQRARDLLRDGKDPLEEKVSKRKAAREAEAAKKQLKKAEDTTLARVARAYHERMVEPVRTEKHGRQWITSLEQNVPAELWNAPIADIRAVALLDALVDIQGRVFETARRVRQRLELVFNDAELRGLTTGNPARAIRKELRDAAARRARVGFSALDYRKAPAFITQLRGLEGIAARALEFGMLTASRTGEIIGALWSEFDLDAGLWDIPAARMKRKTEAHRVYLSPRAVEIVKAHEGFDARYVFPSPMLGGKPLSNMAMLALLRRMKVAETSTVHGMCRTTFSTWANETAAARPDVIEASLAHQEANAVRRAYNRAQFVAERRALMNRWGAFLDGQEEAQVVVEGDFRRAG